jgi:copper chaperone CopZ
MSKGLIVVAVLIVVVLAVVSWQASSEGESAASAREEAAAQTQEASPEPGAGPADDGSAASAPEEPADDPAGTMQTKRLAVENILQVGGFGCVSCQAVVAGTLRKSDGVEDVTYEPETDTYLVTVNDGFRMDEVAGQIRSISNEYNRRLGLPDSLDWVLKEV